MSDSTLKSTVRQRRSHKITAYISMSLSLLVSKTQSSPMSLENQQFLRITRILVIFFKEHFNYCQFLDRQEHFQLLNPFESCPDTRWKLSNPSDTMRAKCCLKGKVSLLGVDSLWADCAFIPADWGSQQQICAILLFLNTFHYKND